ncbi:MAG TPA: hypothetical protein VHM25_17645 [Polyangiaceae bacterium]|jgi:hypothetical protein|nr:hypothetical protein [Polyangiaceae bacterium]
MLRFAYWAGLGGVICSLGLALAAWRALPLASQAAAYIVLFISVFISFAPAIIAHPARTRSGANFNLAPRALLVAEPWTLVLTFATILALAASSFWLSPRGDDFAIASASLIGRVDRQLTLCCFFATFHAFALCAASSGTRWGLHSAGAISSSWPASLGSPSIGRDPRLTLPGAPLTYRTARVGWLIIALEFAGSVAAIVFAGHQLQEALPLPHANLLALALLAVPFWHLFLKSCGHVTFVLEENFLVSQHFPFSARNRRIPLAEIRGIQVNAELDDEGHVTHHSLLLVRDHASTDRLVDHLPSAEHARALAQQIDTLVRIGATRAH